MKMRARILLLSSSMLASIATSASLAQTELPEVKVEAPKDETPKPPAKPAAAAKPAPREEAAAPRRVVAPQPVITAKPAGAPRVAQPIATPPSPQQVAAQAAERVIQTTRAFDQQRNFITNFTGGASSYEITNQNIENMPGGTNTPLDKVLLQAPGVTQDSAASGLLHI